MSENTKTIDPIISKNNDFTNCTTKWDNKFKKCKKTQRRSIIKNINISRKSSSNSPAETSPNLPNPPKWSKIVQKCRFWTLWSESLRVFCKRDLGTCYVFKTGILHQICGSPSGFSFWGGDLWWDTGEGPEEKKPADTSIRRKKHAHGTKRDEMIGYEMCYLSTHYVFGQVGYIHTYHLLNYHEAGLLFKMAENDDKMDKISKITWTIWNQKEQNINIMGAISMGIPKTLEIIQIQ